MTQESEFQKANNKTVTVHVHNENTLGLLMVTALFLGFMYFTYKTKKNS